MKNLVPNIFCPIIFSKMINYEDTSEKPISETFDPSSSISYRTDLRSETFSMLFHRRNQCFFEGAPNTVWGYFYGF